ncbi:isochorismatase hydrolase [Biscogniauxia marginata]|nr:isochorismatase hydrolase [Biscogniauxia marginata]
MDKTALLVLDIQNGIVDRLKGVLDSTNYLDRLGSTIAAARAAQIPVIQVTTGFRETHADVSPRNPMMAARAREGGGGGALRESDASTRLHPAVIAAHGGGDGEEEKEKKKKNIIHVRKRRVSAFHATDLDLVLRSLGVGALAVAGVATGGAVLSTVRQAADLDYGVAVLADLCADADPEVHDVLTRSVFPRQAAVLTAEEWVRRLRE